MLERLLSPSLILFLLLFGLLEAVPTIMLEEVKKLDGVAPLMTDPPPIGKG